MPPPVIGLLVVAAVLHAAWNVLLKTAVDPLRMAARAVGSAMVIVTPLAAAFWWLSGRPGMPPEAWLLAGLSGVAELAYFVFLSAAYRRGELSTIYPLARGSAPLLSVLVGLLVLNERLSPLGLAGVACLLAGLWAVRRPTVAGPAVLSAVLTGVTIAAYSAIDRVGVRLGPAWLYGWALWTAGAVLLWAWVCLDRRLRLGVRLAGRWAFFRWSGSPDEPVDPGGPQVVLVGLLMVMTYLLVLIALTVAPLTEVAPLRESAIVLAAGWGVLRLGERRGAWLRLAGAGAIFLGAVLLALS